MGRMIRSHSVELALLALLIAAIGYFAYLAYGLMPGSVADQPFSGSRALDHARQIASFGPRPVGSTGNKRAGEWIVQYVQGQSWDIVLQPFTATNQLPAQNIIAIRSPNGVNAPVGLVVTHYDSRLLADADPNPANRETAGVAANKSASGVAILAELARTLDIEESGHTICLAFFDAEENGGLPDWEPNIGSRLFLENLDISANRCASPRFVIVVNQVGAANAVIQPIGVDGTLDRALRTIAVELGYGDRFQAVPVETKFNNVNWFLEHGIESATIQDSTYPFTDSLSDTVDKLKSNSLEEVGQTLEVWLERGGDFAR